MMFFGIAALFVAFFVLVNIAILYDPDPNYKKETKRALIFCLVLAILGVSLIYGDVIYSSKNSEWRLDHSYTTNLFERNNVSYVFDQPVKVEVWKYNTGKWYILSGTKTEVRVQY